MAQQFERDKNGKRLVLQGGMNTAKSLDLLGDGEYAYLQNVRRYLDGRITSRLPLGENTLTGALSDPPNSLVRMNDTTPNGPGSGYCLIIGSAGNLYVNTTKVASGLSANPLTFIPYDPASSPQPWCYVADNSLAASILSPAYPSTVAGMFKVRSDGTTYKMGIAEPQAAPSITVSTGVEGPNWVTYRYVYRSKITGALSNPSPESVPQNVPQDTVAGTLAATSANVSFNTSQYQVNSGQLRTSGGVAPGTLTDYIIPKNFGLTVPTGVNIDGIQIATNWAGQYSGTGIIANVALFYQGKIIGQVKSPGIQNQQSYTTATQGAGSDSWGAILTPTIVNDTTFGFGIQVLTAQSGGSDRSFFNNFQITVYYTSLSSTGTCTSSTDPQVDTIDVYRQTPNLQNFTYVLSVANSSPSFTDTLSDLVISTNSIIQFDNYEPFPSIDLPRSGTCNVGANGAITWASGDIFSVRWLPGTAVLIDGVAFILYNRPSDTTHMLVYTTVTSDTGFITFGYPPTASGVSYSIVAPDLAAEPSPAIWGPTPDNAGSFYYGIDPNNPGTLLWCKGNNFDSAPDTNRLYVTSPSEPLMNGTVTSELSTVFSTERFWLIYPNFSDAVATVTGTLGSQWTLVQAASTRGLFARFAIAAVGSLIAFAARDGIFTSSGGGPEQSITDSIRNLFSQEGTTPQPVAIGSQIVAPPSYANTNSWVLAFAPGYLYFDYQDVNGNHRTLVYDMHAKGWSVDVYSPIGTAHCWQVGPASNAALVGCADGTVRAMLSTGTESASAIAFTGAENGGDDRATKRIGDVFLRALVASSSPVTVGLWKTLSSVALSGFSPAVLTGSGSIANYIVDFTAGQGNDLDNISLQLSWAIGSGNILDLWQPDWVPLAEVIQDQPSGWDNCGTPGNKLIQGIILELNTFNAAKMFSAQRSDDYNIFTPIECPVAVNGQGLQTFTFNPPFTAHMVRRLSTDGIPWQAGPSGGWELQWIFEPYPEASKAWIAEATSFGQMGFQHAYAMNLAYIAVSPVTVTLVTDQGMTLTLTFTATSQPSLFPAKVFKTWAPGKWKVARLSATSSQPFYLWRDLCELWIKQWGSDGEYVKVKPFGSATALQDSAKI